MKLSPKEVFICVGSGLAISAIAFVIAFFVKPEIITSEGFWVPVGLLPMVVITGIRLNRNEARKKRESNSNQKDDD